MSAFSELAAAYEGMERIDSFADDAALAHYRSTARARTGPQSDFIAKLLQRQTRLVEVGSGNGRLLIDLALRGTVAHALGIELSQSRTEFARRWARDAGCSQQLDLRVGDALALELETGTWDAAACVTGTFAYFDAVEPGSARRLLDRLRLGLRPGGILVLELYPHVTQRRLLAAAGNSVRTWRELDAGDPWRYYLSALRLEGDVLTHHKVFVHRRTGEVDEGRHERIVLYTPEAMGDLLTAAGFPVHTMRDGWTDTPYAGGDLLVITATRP